MKNATKHAEELRSLLKKLLREQKPDPKPTYEPLQAFVRGAMTYDAPDARVEDAMAVIAKEFVDLNELRVATELEVQDLLGTRFPGIEKRVAMITAALNNIFEREHTLSLDRLKTLSKRDARQFIRELPDIHPFVEAYVMLFAFGGQAFPTDDETVTYLRDHNVLDDAAGVDEAQRFVEHHLKAEECYELFAAVRKVLPEEGTKAAAKKKK